MKIDFGHITQILVAFIGLFGIIYSKRQRENPKTNTLPEGKQILQRPRKYLLLFWISLALTCFNLGIFGWRILENDSIYIEIIYPKDGNPVSIREIVKGKSKNIPNNKLLWIIVYSFPSGKHFPNHNPAQIDKKGNWTSPVIIGSTEDQRKYFYISAYLIDDIDKNNVEEEINELDFQVLKHCQSI